MGNSSDEFIFSMKHSGVILKALFQQRIIDMKSVRINRRVIRYFALNHFHKSLTFNVADYSHIGLARDAFIEAEKNGFPLRSSPPFSSHSSCSQVAFIQLKDSWLMLIFLLTKSCQANPQQPDHTIDCIAIQSCQNCDLVASISIIKRWRNFLNWASEIRERKMYLLCTNREYVNVSSNRSTSHEPLFSCEMLHCGLAIRRSIIQKIDQNQIFWCL